MSAITHSVDGSAFNRKAFLIGLHADHRPQDVYFPRTQSLELQQAKWISRIRPMRSWGEITLWGLAAVMFIGETINLVR